MSEILEINGANIKVGNDDGSIATLPIASVQFPNPKVGDQVRVYKDNESVLVTRVNPVSNDTAQSDSDRRKINKIAYILITFFFGAFGVHRFMRGQVGLGLLMLFLGSWLTLGIWPLVDFIISLVKLSSYQGDDYVFTPDGRFIK